MLGKGSSRSEDGRKLLINLRSVDRKLTPFVMMAPLSSNCLVINRYTAFFSEGKEHWTGLPDTDLLF
jgi:hypothetical protein